MPVLDIIKAKILMKNKSFAKAKVLLESLYRRTKILKTGQRQSTLPIICRALVESDSASSISDGVDWLNTCRDYLPPRIAGKLAIQMAEIAAHTREQLSPTHSSIINQASVLK